MRTCEHGHSKLHSIDVVQHLLPVTVRPVTKICFYSLAHVSTERENKAVVLTSVRPKLSCVHDP